MATVDSPAATQLLEPLVRRRSVPALVRSRRLWAVLGVYGVSRLYSSGLLLIGLAVSNVIPQTIPSYTGSPTFLIADGSTYRQSLNFLTFSSLWDGEYYRYIFAHGYPTVLPTNGQGGILPNPWAFLPGYPMLVRGLSLVTHLGFFSLGPIVSVLFGAAATVVLYKLVSDRVGPRPAWFAALVFAFGPLAFLLQASYAESMFFFLMFSSMYLLQKRRYYWLIAPAFVAAFTRPGEVALALALVIVFVVRLRAARWGRDTAAFPVSERVSMIVAGAVTGAAGIAWPFIAAFATGIPSAYTSTELAWRVGYIGLTHFMPFTAWFTIASRYLGAFGVLIVCAAIVGYVRWMNRASTRRLGLETIASVSSYMLYLLAVFMPQQSFFRVAIPAAPLLGDPQFVERPVVRRAILWGGIALQPVAIAALWYLANP